MIETSRRQLRILVVDDNLDTAMGLSLLMRALGHKPHMTHDGLSAVDAALECQPDLVLLDIGLPGMDGWEVARRFRQDPTLSDVTLVAVTGRSGDEAKCRAVEAGFDHFIVKPADVDQLQKIMAVACEI